MQTHEATVVGASLVAFIPGVSLEQRKAVKLASLWAESTTLQDMAGESAQDQYQYYRKKLMYLGWDAKSAEEVHWPDPQRPKIVDQALRRIDAVAGVHHSSNMALAFEVLKKNGKPLLHFESRSKDRAQFQLLSCAPVSGNYVDIVVYHEAGNSVAFTTGFLFRERRDTRVTAELVRFNTRLFDQERRSAVERALVKIALKEIHEMAI
ncbi:MULTISPECIES: hypothetical protein [unclassified Pseudomonas]|jgi:hypothetical protein|uniref:hypothetical protein n=1 Tax=unclassified Pseudomonas TaxID=196821 RepID=UPI0004224249|nr:MULTISPECIES: hypothetical protein [unclassified Pseudomonas]MCX2688907.1 hypothetical protein [Pseudomonas sp. DCB_AW]SME95834.1 hypothetical protein SAMN02745962_00724 [Pseudomonas sp. LAIL14HWK12:I11]SMR68736.1 hypothetical protein SAMN05661028_00725 [Pseudomonas sp. LAIL14HWK12:I10]SOD00968.1 hypothetical protein SAMN05660296_00726 [Pseudomonas sp. LAIL14HWK12:I8]